MIAKHIESLPYMSIKVRRCIVTGKKATLFTGHLIAKHHDNNLVVGAGFADKETYLSHPCKNMFGREGCYGTFNPKYGIELDEFCD